MAEVNIKYCCGCGFTTTNLAEAVLHSDLNKHSLDVVGRIVKPKLIIPKQED